MGVLACGGVFQVCMRRHVPRGITEVVQFRLAMPFFDIPVDVYAISTLV